MKIKINLFAEDIIEKNFSINLKGYDMNEVDYFLDLIKKDYENWKIIEEQKINEIDELVQKQKALEENIKILQNHIVRFKNELNDLQNKGFGNIDIIRRLNKLEEK